MACKIMGIVNVTPDSFFDGGNYSSTELAVAHALQLIDEGADLLDIGGESSRPGSSPVTVQEELSRVLPVIERVRARSDIPISIDTVKPDVARAAIQAGATLINDISGFRNPEMRKTAADSGLPICVMHMQGEPKTMQLVPKYSEGIIPHLLNWFEDRIQTLEDEGIQKDQIILDPGIGFGKTVEDNLAIIENLQKFRAMGFPILLGLSRKSFIYKTLGLDSSEILEPTIAMNTIGIVQGVEMIRVHDVAAHRKVVDFLEVYLQRE